MPKKTLKNRIRNYHCNSGSRMLSDGDMDREEIVQQIIAKYKIIAKNIEEPDEYLSWLSNDITVFIGFRVELAKRKNKEGLKLWDEMTAKSWDSTETSELSRLERIKTFLGELPMYYLLAFLGFAAYKETIGTPQETKSKSFFHSLFGS